MQTSQNSETPSPETPRVLGSRSGIVLAATWLYMLGWGMLMAIAALQPGPGGWELGEWLMTGAVLVPIVIIPLYLVHCAKRIQTPRLRHWLPWAVRILYVSAILAMCDSWAAGTERRAPVFSRAMWKLRDGGTTGYIGFGYSLTYHRQIGGEHGPEVWFWFTPFTLSWTTEHTGLRWLWQH